MKCIPPAFTLITVANAAIHCIKPDTLATATWTQRDGTTCTFSDTVGSNYKHHDAPTTDHRDRDECNCMGKCGVGCHGTDMGEVFTQDCFNHDMCTYWNDKNDRQRRSHDPHCGDEYTHCINDWGFGWLWKCKVGDKKTEELSAREEKVPKGYPVCHKKGENILFTKYRWGGRIDAWRGKDPAVHYEGPDQDKPWEDDAEEHHKHHNHSKTTGHHKHPHHSESAATRSFTVSGNSTHTITEL